MCGGLNVCDFVEQAVDPLFADGDLDGVSEFIRTFQLHACVDVGYN